MIGIRQFIGDFGVKVARWAIGKFTPIAEVLGLIRPAAPRILPHDVLETLKSVRSAEKYVERIRGIGWGEQIPGEFYIPFELPRDYRYGYNVELYGRDLATGRYQHIDVLVNVSREMTPGEAIDQAVEWVGAEGEYPRMDVWRTSMTEAWVRTGEAPW